MDGVLGGLLWMWMRLWEDEVCDAAVLRRRQRSVSIFVFAVGSVHNCESQARASSGQTFRGPRLTCE